MNPSFDPIAALSIFTATPTLSYCFSTRTIVPLHLRINMPPGLSNSMTKSTRSPISNVPVNLKYTPVALTSRVVHFVSARQAESETVTRYSFLD